MSNNTNIVLPTGKLSRKDLVTLIQDELTIDLEDQIDAASSEFEDNVNIVRQYQKDNNIRQEYCGIYSLHIDTPHELKEKLKELYDAFLSLASETCNSNSDCGFSHSIIEYHTDGSLKKFTICFPSYRLNEENVKKYVSEAHLEVINRHLSLMKEVDNAKEKITELQGQLEALKKNTRRLNAQIIRNELTQAGPNGAAVLEGLEKMKTTLRDKLVSLDKTKLLKNK